jgi:hypothetical protein
MISTSFGLTWPSMLHKTSGEYTGEVLNQMLKFEAWQNLGKGTSVVSAVEREMPSSLSNILRSCSTRWPGKAKVIDLVMNLNSSTNSFWNGLRNFAQNFYAELTSDPRADPESTWRIVREMMGSYLQAFRQAHSVGVSATFMSLKDSSDITEKTQVITDILWGTLQGHRVMKEIVQADF